MQWDEAVDRFTTTLKMADRSANTIAAYLSDLSLAADYWANARKRPEVLDNLANLTSDDIANWFFDLRRQRKSRQTVLRRQASLKLFLAYAVEQRWLAASPYPESGVIKAKGQAPEREIVYLDTHQAQAFMAAVHYGLPNDPDWVQARDAALFWLMLGTGLRISEAVQLTMKDVADGIRRGQLNIIGKGDKRRQVALPEATYAPLTAYREVRPATELNAFFVTQRRIPKGQHFPITPLSAREVQRRIQQYGAQAELPLHLTPHKLRHTYATALLEAGMDIRIVQEALGHAHLSTTEIYAHVNVATQKEAANRLPYFKGNPQDK
ncbi:tyrosine-type recombinase/integrase [Sulfobacillus harzensis]|uniref:Tyrosine-type recombinase/integrase n=1 Tax=Sulfobacillus harzensis TaxID=2729629 RepID=A0A7Y0L9P0_9FIRM|nr:tyrosine-type recombinase/integrase [Sulfobacillus harzensis]NMP25065.1 tyrosine-type recombinase/integrase [Sulfobacillus harzensis]